MTEPVRRRRPRYAGKYPRRFEEKYKERQPERYVETVAKVLASGKTPAGTHRPIMVSDILDVLAKARGHRGRLYTGLWRARRAYLAKDSAWRTVDWAG